MHVLLLGIAFFVASFLVQFAVWRIALPRRQTRAILAIYTLVPLCLVGGLTLAGHPIHGPASAAFSLALFYVSLVLAYAVLYSAIEMESPTLAIVSFVAKAGTDGCGELALVERFGADRTMASRMIAMRGSLIVCDEQTLSLTPQGRWLAVLFDQAGRLFGLPKGG